MRLHTIILILLISTSFFSTCLQKPPVTVEWTVVEHEPAIEIVPANGLIAPGRFLSLSFLKNGMVSECMVAEGNDVKAGDTLAFLDKKEGMNIVAQYRTDVAMARVTLDQLTTTGLAIAAQKRLQARIIENTIGKKVGRAEAMLLQGSITQAALDELKKEQALAISQRIIAESEYDAHSITEPKLHQIRIDKAQILLNDAQIALSHTFIIAPSDGKIIKKHYTTGEMYITGTPFFTFLSIDTVLTIAIEVPVASLHKIHQGQQVILRDPGTTPFLANTIVSAVVPLADTVRGTARVFISSKIPAISFVTNQNILVDIVTDTLSSAIVLQKKFLLGEVSSGLVFIKKGDLAEKRSVVASFTTDGRYIIQRGLISGDTAIYAGQLEQGSLLKLGKNIK
jgi:multidrug efflux pump subunit AcrA (membrane-fusion protein)